jgi:Na(+)-translocating NADH:ubiquinone oxidoreductase A subunit
MKTFSGGYKFKRFQGQAQDRLDNLESPLSVAIPLFQGFGVSLEPKVSVGDKVSAGQIIASNDAKISSPVHSSISGRVSAIKKMNYFKREVTMVVIEADGSDDYKKLEGFSSRWGKLSSQQIQELLYKSGVTSLDREGIPTSFKTSIIGPNEVEDLIIHGVSSEAYNISLKVLLSGKNLFNFVEGIKILKKVMPKARVHLALSCKERKILERIKKLATGLDNLNIYPIVPKYPQGYDEVLVPTLLGKKFPYGYSAANIGIVVLNIQAILHAYEAVAEGKPLIERTIALCGPGFKDNLHLKVKVGTSLEQVLKGQLKPGPLRIVLNSLITSLELNDLSLPVSRVFSQLIAIPEDNRRKLLTFLRPGIDTDSCSRTFLSSFFKRSKLATTNLRGEERPCLQCGYCLKVCPVSIMPTVIDRYIKFGINETLMQHGIFNCIECNLCSYVCPSKVPLSQNLKTAKRKLIDIGCDQSLCILPRFNMKGLQEYKGVKKLR